MRRVAGELLGQRVVAGGAAERLVILRDLVLTEDLRMGRVCDIDQTHPSPGTAKAGVRERAIDLVSGKR